MQSTASETSQDAPRSSEDVVSAPGRLVSPVRQRFVIVTMVAVAFVALVVAAKFSAPTEPGAAVLTGAAADGGGDRNDATNGAAVLQVSPVEGWLPEAGNGTACSERVGVDLIPGYAATLEINGVQIPAEEMNNYIDEKGGSQDAGASIGEYTWGPEQDCPHGTILRPTQNKVIACIYRVEEGIESCQNTPRPDDFSF